MFPQLQSPRGNSPQQSCQEESLDAEGLCTQQGDGGDGPGAGAGCQDQATGCGESRAIGNIIVNRYI